MEDAMRAADIMTRDVITVAPEDSVQDVARLLVKQRISATPVLDSGGSVVGIVSERDLMRRAEIDTDEKRSWLRRAWAGRERLALDYVRTHAGKVADIMTSNVITANPDTSLRDIASLLEQNGIKRVPIVEAGKLVGIVSRADLLRAFAALPVEPAARVVSDDEIRKRLYARLQSQHWISPSTLNVAVDHGVVEVWAAVNSHAERKAICVAAETIPGVIAVNDHIVIGPFPSGY
jgi:CBS domain-containing protein